MTTEIEVPGLPQPPKRSPPGGVVVRKILKVKAARRRFIGPRLPKAFGPVAPKGHRSRLRAGTAAARKSARAQAKADRAFLSMVRRGQKRIDRAAAQAARKAARAAGKGKGRPRRGKRATGRQARATGRRGGYRRSRSGSLGWLLALAKKIFFSKGPSKDFRNHGFTKSGHRGRTGFAGMKRKGRLF